MQKKTIGDVVYDLAKTLTDVHEGFVTTADATSIIDSKNLKPAGYFVRSGDPYGICLYSHYANGVGPFTHYRAITSHSVAGTFVIGLISFGETTLLGARYAAMPGSKFPMYVLLQALNDALAHDIGPVPFVLEFTSTGYEQYELTAELPITADGPVIKVLKVEVASDEDGDGGATPYEWTLHTRWHLALDESDNETRLLVFDDEDIPDADLDMRVTVLAYHQPFYEKYIDHTEMFELIPTPVAEYKYLSSTVDYTRLIAEAKVRALTWLYMQRGPDDAALGALLNAARADAMTLRAQGNGYPSKIQHGSW